MLNLPKALGLILAHMQTAATAVVTWWSRMSVADKRQTRQRVLTIGACAAVFAPAVSLLHSLQVSQTAISGSDAT